MPVLIIKDERKGKVKEISLTRSRFTIGKGELNDLVLPRKSISREHCLIFRKDERYWVRDLDSRRGTFLGDTRLQDDAVLDHGARLRLGEFEIQFRDAAKREAQKGPKKEPKKEAKKEPKRDTKKELKKEPRRERKKKSSRPAAPEAAEPEAAEAGPFLEAQRLVHARLFESRELKRLDFDALGEAEAREKTEAIAVQIIRELTGQGAIPAGIEKRRLLKAVLDEALGLGPLEDLLADDNINEIMVNAWNRVFVETKDRGMILTEAKFTSNEQVIHIIRRIIAPIGRRINEQTPLVDARLKDGSRVNAIIPPLAVSGPSITIRKFPKERYGVEDLIGFGSLSEPMAAFLSLCVRERLNIVISGGTGSGKTTLLNVVSGYIPTNERIVTVEDVSELKLPQVHVVTLEARAPNLEGKGEVTIRDLVKNCLRMNPDRIVIGECRSGEALDMLQAMNTGHDGSLTTLHSNSPRDCMARLETLVLMSGMELPTRAIREQIASAVHLVIQQARLPDGQRKVTDITEICGMEGETITLQDIYKFRQTGYDEDGRALGYHDATGVVPNFVQSLRKRGVKVDMSIFKPTHRESAGA